MIPVLSPVGVASIELAARARALLAFDFDGTLAPIVADRTQAQMRDTTRDLLRMAATLYPCAVISGRDRADVAARIADIPLVAVIGNHGAEPEGAEPDARTARRLRTWAATLRGTFEPQSGIEVEEKAFSLAIHYSGLAGGSDGPRRVLEAALALPGSRVFGGHEVLNVAPLELAMKGYAVDALAREHVARAVVFVGDDVTDEDAFCSRAVTLGIRVGSRAASAARFYLPGQQDIEDLLRAFVAMRSRLDGVSNRRLDLRRSREGEGDR